MRTLAVMVVVVLACGAIGCGKSDKPDNSHIQTPNDQPIGGPGAVPAGGKGNLTPVGAPQPLGGATLGPGNEKGGGKPLPIVEIKQ